MASAVRAALAYRDPNHERLPHVVRFSGGRSSALMTLRLASEGVLRRDRGDVVLFANTTAEHPGTYEFAHEVCEEIEGQFGVPSLWYEGCAVEAATRAGYTRSRTFRLVRRVPEADGDDPRWPGYRSRGEAFEEMVSWTRLPSRWRRMDLDLGGFQRLRQSMSLAVISRTMARASWASRCWGCRSVLRRSWT